MSTNITSYYPQVDVAGLTTEEAFRKLLFAYLITDIKRHNKLSEAGVPETDDEFLSMLVVSVDRANYMAQDRISKYSTKGASYVLHT